LYIVAVAVAVVIALAKVKGAGCHWPSSRPVAAAATCGSHKQAAATISIPLQRVL